MAPTSNSTMMKDGMPHFGTGVPYLCLTPADVQRVYTNGVFFGESSFFFGLPLLLIQILAIHLISRAFYIVLRPLRQPRIICNILAGIILGPTVPEFWKGGGIRSNYYLGYPLFPPKQKTTLRSLSTFGMMYHMFLIGVKTDIGMVRRTGKRAITIGLASMFVPFLFTLIASWALRKYVKMESFLLFSPATLSSTAFPVLADLLSEIRLLNSELGRLAMSAAIITDTAGWCFMVIFMFIYVQVALPHGMKEAALMDTLYVLLAILALVLAIVFVFRPWLERLSQSMPRGAPMPDRYMLAIFILVMITGLISDVIGMSYIVVPLVLGIAVPDGPPIGSAIVQRTEMVVSEIFVPLFFATLGQICNVRQVLLSRTDDVLGPQYGSYGLLFLIAVVANLGGTIAAGVYTKMSLFESFLLGLIMNFKGLLELLTYVTLSYAKILEGGIFTMLVLMVLLTTGIAVPTVEALYKPLELVQARAARRRRTVQRLKPQEELRVTVCVSSEDSVPFLIPLLELFCSIDGQRHLCAYVIHLVELVGAANSALITHKNKKGFINPTRMDPLLNNFIAFEQLQRGNAYVLPFTAVAPPKTMHHDACTLAAERSAAFLLTPFPRRDNTGGGMSVTDETARTIAADILRYAPCSVGLLVYPSTAAPSTSSDHQVRRVAVLFWGGPDDRETLAIAALIADNEQQHYSIEVIVLKFVPETDRRRDEERKKDDAAVNEFVVKNAGNKRTVVEEVSVSEVEQIFGVLRRMERKFDLVIVGRTQGESCMLDEEGIAEWSEWKELGVVGDILASPDFDCQFSILVVQQQQQQQQQQQCHQ